MICRIKTNKQIQPNLRYFSATSNSSPYQSPVFKKRRDYTPINLSTIQNSIRSCYSRKLNFFKTVNEPPREKTASSLISTLRSRNKKANSYTTTPLIAKSVLRLYFLPFFQERQKINLDKSRTLSFGSPKKHQKQTFESLTEILKKKLEEAKLDLSRVRSRHDAVNKEINSMKKKVKIITKKNLLIQANKAALRLTQTELEPNQLKHFLQSPKDNFFKIFTENQELHNTFYTEKEQNDRLKVLSVYFDTIHNGLYLNNQIFGESLKGVYYSLTSIKNPEHTEAIISFLKSLIHNNSKNKIARTDSRLATFTTVLSDNRKFTSNSNKVFKSRTDVVREIKSLRTAVVSYMENLTDSNKASKMQKEKLSEELEIRSKNYERVVEDYKLAHEQIVEYQRLNRSKNKEILCKNCNKEYIEQENFNWSCARHGSEWNGVIYWCCGESNKYAVGCQKSKHEEIKEEDASLLKDEKSEVLKFCSACKKNGHVINECLLDPNHLDHRAAKFELRKAKRKIGTVHRSMSSTHMWVKERIELKKDKFDDIELLKEGVSRNATPDQTILSKSSIGSFWSVSKSALSTNLTPRR